MIARLFATALLVLPSLASAQDATRLDASLTLSVSDRATALDAVVQDAQAHGGWFSQLSNSQVTVRVPTDELRPTLERVGELGQVLDRSYQATDLSAELTDLDSRLKARQDVLQRYLDVLQTAGADSVVTVEREITRVVQEIEQIKGRQRFLRDRADFAQIVVDFRYQDRAAPVRDGSSSFAWLNTMNVADLMSDVGMGQRANASHAHLDAPEDFAAWPHPGHFQALAPDGTVLRVRSARNKPVADLDFWREALRTRMVEAGYHLREEQDISASGTPGAMLLLGAANGQRDQTYLVGLFVKNRRLIVVEATGEAEAFTTHQDAIIAAIQGMEL